MPGPAALAEDKKSAVSRQVFRSYLKRIKPLHTGVRALKARVAKRRETVWTLEGQEHTSGEPLTVLFGGPAGSRNYIARLIFGESLRETGSTRVWKSRLLQQVRATGGRHDLTIVQCDSACAATDSEASLFQVPCWIGGEKDLTTAAEFARHSEHIKSDVRRIRKHRLDYRVTDEPAAFEHFYHTMYLPYIEQVFGDNAFLMSYQDMQAAIPRSELFLVTQDGVDIAGGILVYDGSERVRGWSLGVKDGDSSWVRLGALAAFEHLQTGYLLEKGFSRLHRGGSRPFLKDGALCFKKNRGMRIMDRTTQSFMLLPKRDCAGVRAFLQENPFIYETEGKLKGAIFVPGAMPAEEDVAQLFHKLHAPGLDGLTLFFLADVRGGELSARVLGQIDAAGHCTQPGHKD